MALHTHGVENTSNDAKNKSQAKKKLPVAKKSNQLLFGNQVVQLSDEGEIIARRPVGNIKAGNAEERKTNK